MPATITFFPVDNGDMTLVTLDTGRTILIDCNIRNEADDEDGDAFDVAGALRDRLPTDAQGRRYVDVMVLSHPDKDHCLGLERHFHLGPLDKWDRDDDKIVIREMWSSPMVFRRASKQLTLVPDAKVWNQEARRRVGLYRDNPYATPLVGDRILIMGEDENGKTDDIPGIVVPVDHTISQADGQNDGTFVAWLLGPLPIAADEEEDELAKNRSSIILRFSLTGDGCLDAGRFLTGGDAEVGVWRRLWARHGPNAPERLEYDILLSPHHCSWHSLSEDSWSDPSSERRVDTNARNSLSQTRFGAVIVASSKEILDDNSDPPCIGAKDEYVDIVDGNTNRFFCTGDTPDDVLEFEIGSSGPKKKARSLASLVSVLGVGAAARTPRDHGRRIRGS